MSDINFLLLLMICLSTTDLISAAYLPRNLTVAKLDCVDRCGNISIPFPFGTTQSCSAHKNFLVTCNQSFYPPKLFMHDKKDKLMEVTNITLGGQVTILFSIAKDCHDMNGSRVHHADPELELPDYFVVSNTANVFTSLGCDTKSFFSGEQMVSGQSTYQTGCITTCSREDIDDDLVLQAGSCGGLGCCQMTSIAQDVWKVKIDLDSFNNHTQVWEFSNCSYGFLVEVNGFRFYRENLTNFKNVEKLPMVADWAIGNGTCESAQLNSSTYACKSLYSECYKPDNGYGYRCQCKAGYEGNPYLHHGCTDIDECMFPELSGCIQNCVNSLGSFTCQCHKGYHVDGLNHGSCISDPSHTDRIIAGVSLGIILVLLIICLIYFGLKRRRSRNMKYMFFLQNGGVLLQEKLRASGRREMPFNNDMTKIFNSTELQTATKNFHSSMIVGQGGFGTVYKGFLDDNRPVAIKKSKNVDPSQIEQFINEFVVLSQISHRNVVKLLGCCLETPVPLLVYEFIDNGTLYDHIHDHHKKRFLGWYLRLKIAIETADVLSYLHSTVSVPIIHRDVKSSNILLDDSFSAKVADFGASRLVPMDQTRLSTIVQGTFGYLDPEYMQTNQLTEKSDVYSFGVVLVELLTAMKAVSYDRPEGEMNLANLFLCRLKQGCLSEILDETIMCTGNEEQLTGVAKLAQVCLNVKGEDRPNMKEVATELEGIRSGGKPKLKQNAAEAESSFSGKGIHGFFDIDGYSTSTCYDSHTVTDQSGFKGGR